VDRDAGVSTRQVEQELNASRMIIWTVLHEQLHYPYHLQRVWGLMFADFLVRENFCEVLSISLFHQRSLQIRPVSVEMASSIFTINTSGQRTILMV
jgi:hypothetical protein